MKNTHILNIVNLTEQEINTKYTGAVIFGKKFERI